MMKTGSVMTKKEEKPTQREKRAIKRREVATKAAAVFGVGKGFGEPTINPLNYRADLIRALNHYNTAEDNKTKKKWALQYIAKVDKALVKKLEDVKDYEFSSLGVIVRLLERDQPLEDSELNFIEKRIKDLIDISENNTVSVVKVAAQEKQPAPKVTKQKEATHTHAGELMGMIDDFVKHDKPFDLESYLKSANVSSSEAKVIPSKFTKAIEEIELVLKGTDKQLVEGWSNIKKVKLKKLLEVYKSISTICAQHGVLAKAPRKPRATKVKPATVVASKVKYMAESTELGVKSVHPSTVVDSTEVWVFNTKYKKLQVYRALSGQKLTVKGTTIINYSVEDSKSKTLRKPEEVATIVGMTKKTFSQYFDKLKTKDSAVNGRINEDTLILKAI
jgi:cytochrome c556